MHELIVEFDKLASGGVPDAVPEMMARSGGFNVPVDYFKKGQMPAPVPAMPSHAPGSSGNRWPLYGGIAGVLAAIAIVVGIFAKSQSSAAVQTPVVASNDAVAKPLEPAPVLAAAPAPTVAPTGKQVLLAAEPIDAHVFRDGEDLGQSPVMLTIEAGKPMALEIRRDGYKPEKVTLDGSNPREIVKLGKAARAGVVYRPAPKKAEAATQPAVKKPKASIGGSEIVNPWGN
jgi:serine/threonine-protein kinase